MLHPGLYEQVINNALSSELSEIPEPASPLHPSIQQKPPKFWHST